MRSHLSTGDCRGEEEWGGREGIGEEGIGGGGDGGEGEKQKGCDMISSLSTV